jgi:hypothetical protein
MLFLAGPEPIGHLLLQVPPPIRRYFAGGECISLPLAGVLLAAVFIDKGLFCGSRLVISYFPVLTILTASLVFCRTNVARQMIFLSTGRWQKVDIIILSGFIGYAWTNKIMDL